MLDARTEDTLHGGRVRLSQPKDGYRVAIDPVLLAAAVPADADEVVLDAGAGTGAAALCLAARVQGCRVVGLELARELARIARDNIDTNDLAWRVEVLAGDLATPPPRLAPESFDQVMTNPPHLEAAAATAPPGRGRAGAHVEGRLDLDGWLKCCLRMVRPGGRLTLIHRAERLGEILAALAGRLGDVVVFPLWPLADGRPARRLLVQGRKGSRAPLRLVPGLVLHAADGGFTAEAEAVLRHGAPLPLA